MSGTPTTRFVDDDAPTTIDRTLCLATDGVAPAGHSPTSDIGPGRLRERATKRWALGTVFGVLAFGVVSGALIRQRAITAQLRRELASLQRVQYPSHTETRSGSEMRAALREKVSPSAVAKLDREELELRAVDALVDSAFAEALAYYEALAERAPHEPAFSDFVSVLRLKSRCAGLSKRKAASCR